MAQITVSRDPPALVSGPILRDEGDMGEEPGSRQTIAPPRRPLCALVTRPRAESEGLCAALAVRGITALVEPLLDIRYRGETLPDLWRMQAVLCTSANGVRALARNTAARDVPIYAVGEATAARARSEGFGRVASAAGAVEDLGRLVCERLRPDAGPLLQVVGGAVAGDLAGELRAAGFTLERAVLYDARPAATLSNACVEALVAAAIDFALFFSPRTAAIFARLVETAGVAAALRRVTAVSISAAADERLGPLPFAKREVSARPEQQSLLAVLDRLAIPRCGA